MRGRSVLWREVEERGCGSWDGDRDGYLEGTYLGRSERATVGDDAEGRTAAQLVSGGWLWRGRAGRGQLLAGSAGRAR